MAQGEPKDSVQVAYEALEHVFNRYFNSKAHESNRHPVGHPSRVEADLTEVEKAHLGLLQSKLHATIAQELLRSLASSATQSDKLGKKVVWLNVVLVILTAVIAASAALPLILRGGV